MWLQNWVLVSTYHVGVTSAQEVFSHHIRTNGYTIGLLVAASLKNIICAEGLLNKKNAHEIHVCEYKMVAVSMIKVHPCMRFSLWSCSSHASKWIHNWVSFGSFLVKIKSAQEVCIVIMLIKCMHVNSTLGSWLQISWYIISAQGFLHDRVHHMHWSGCIVGFPLWVFMLV